MSKDLNSVRISRLFSLVALLSKPVSRDEIIARLEYIGRRTLERDLKFLRDEFGVQIKFSRSKKTYTTEGARSFLVYLKLTRDEVSAVAAGLGMAGHFLPHLKEAGDSAWEKFSACVSRSLLEHGRILSKSTTVSLPTPNVDPSKFEKILDAVTNKTTLLMDYKSPKRVSSRKYTVSPWGLCFRGHAWYIRLWDHKAREGRSFRISRINDIACAKEKYVGPKDGDIDVNSSYVWYVESGEPKYEIKVRIAKDLATAVSETTWHITQTITENKDGSIDFCAKVPNLQEVAWWVLASAPHATVIEPQELRDIVADLAQKVQISHS